METRTEAVTKTTGMLKGNSLLGEGTDGLGALERGGAVSGWCGVLGEGTGRAESTGLFHSGDRSSRRAVLSRGLPDRGGACGGTGAEIEAEASRAVSSGGKMAVASRT
jgi:hypothetical protein